MSYNRVIPRDLFNEANLLKCIGQLVLLIEDRKIPWLTYHHDGDAFNILQNESNGALYVANVQFFKTEGKGNGLLSFERPLNSRDSWPLYLETETDAYSVFDENGKFILDKKAI